MAAVVEFVGTLIVCAMYCGPTTCTSIDAYELFTKFFIGCFFVCIGEITSDMLKGVYTEQSSPQLVGAIVAAIVV